MVEAVVVFCVSVCLCLYVSVSVFVCVCVSAFACVCLSVCVCVSEVHRCMCDTDDVLDEYGLCHWPSCSTCPVELAASIILCCSLFGIHLSRLRL